MCPTRSPRTRIAVPTPRARARLLVATGHPDIARPAPSPQVADTLPVSGDRGDEVDERKRGANGGANGGVAGRCGPAPASPNSLKPQRPALASAGRAGLRIESSTTELRWRGYFAMTYRVGREVDAVVPMVLPKPVPRSASNRAPNLAACCSTRYSTTSARCRSRPRCPYTLRTIASPPCPFRGQPYRCSPEPLGPRFGAVQRSTGGGTSSSGSPQASILT